MLLRVGVRKGVWGGGGENEIKGRERGEVWRKGRGRRRREGGGGGGVSEIHKSTFPFDSNPDLESLTFCVHFEMHAFWCCSTSLNFSAACLNTETAHLNGFALFVEVNK